MTVPGVICIFLFIVFTFSGVSKLMKLRDFEATLEQLGLMNRFGTAAKYFVPLLEIAAAAFLIFRVTRGYGELLVIILLFCFGWAVWRAMHNAQKIECNCFGELAPEKFGWSTLIKISVILTLTVILVISKEEIDYNNSSSFDLVNAIFLSVSIILNYALMTSIIDSRVNKPRRP
ncbi:MauE/DoxX family redox-associated membrane protein [Paenibacillus sp. MBLB4367]|uniref:MauE/DoxX family redox-associated membrane protein n=1 Tax=Paenibacillus sp. MBLB4367 TaxID=3384767 RepID=UPI0039083A3C